jgi:hypothetical protein
MMSIDISLLCCGPRIIKDPNHRCCLKLKVDLIPKSMNEVLRRELWCVDLTRGEVVMSDTPTSGRSTRGFSPQRVRSDTFRNISSEKPLSPEDGKFVEILI